MLSLIKGEYSMKLFAFLLQTIAAVYILVLLTDWMYKKFQNNTYIYVTLGAFALTGAFTFAAIICFFYRRVYRK